MFAIAILILANPYLASDDVSPEKQMEKAIAEYSRLDSDWDSPHMNVREAVNATSQKMNQVIDLHKSLGLEKSPEAYKKATADILSFFADSSKFFDLLTNFRVRDANAI